MKITVAAFYADIPGKPSRLDEFLPFIYASRRALSITNPNARYTILTDINTSTILPNDIERSIAAPAFLPLMLKIIFAQKLFVNTCRDDLIVLPDVDCLVNKDLSEVIPGDVGLAITHRGKKFEHKINNLAYVRNKELAAWFLGRAYSILNTWTQGKQEWDGDQEAWQAVLGAPPDPIPPLGIWSYPFEDLGNDVLVSRVEGRNIHLYPCSTHNCFMSDSGTIRENHKNAYMVHFKGNRKQHLDRWMKYRFG